MPRLRTSLALVGAILLTGACGQRGPLYLPPKAQPATPAIAPPPSPVTVDGTAPVPN